MFGPSIWGKNLVQTNIQCKCANRRFSPSDCNPTVGHVCCGLSTIHLNIFTKTPLTKSLNELSSFFDFFVRSLVQPRKQWQLSIWTPELSWVLGSRTRMTTTEDRIEEENSNGSRRKKKLECVRPVLSFILAQMWILQVAVPSVSVWDVSSHAHVLSIRTNIILSIELLLRERTNRKVRSWGGREKSSGTLRMKHDSSGEGVVSKTD